MSKRKLAWIAVAFVGLLATLGLLWSIFGASRLELSEAMIQARLNQQLPRTVREVTIDRVAVQLAANRLALRVEIQGTVLRQPVAAVVSARGAPRYEAQSGHIYFDADDVKVDRLTIAGRNVTRDEEAARRPLTDAAGAAVQRLAEAAIKAYLATRPVYRFKEDFKGVVLKAALVGVTIEQSSLVVTLSLWSLTVTVGIFGLVLMGVLFAAFWLIRHPLWGLRIGQFPTDRNRP